MSEKDVVLAYWEAMQTNDFYKASELLSEDFECYWPQSAELIVGRHNFAEINTKYPSHDRWRFTVNSIVHEGEQVVTDVDVTDGTSIAKAITFHTVVKGFITKQTEYWPDNYDAPVWRRQWVTIIEGSGDT